MTAETIAGLIRHILTTLGGYLVAKGVIDEATMLQIVGGIGAAAGFIWSMLAKKKTPAVTG